MEGEKKPGFFVFEGFDIKGAANGAANLKKLCKCSSKTPQVALPQKRRKI